LTDQQLLILRTKFIFETVTKIIVKSFKYTCSLHEQSIYGAQLYTVQQSLALKTQRKKQNV